MARRRMFSLDVVDTDSFIEMPSTARLLYYDLGIRADDDGFITPQKVMRMTGASSDDLRVLIAKKFIYSFEDGVVVILHWQRHNKIDASKYTPSIYIGRLREVKDLYIEKLPSGRPNSKLPKPTEKGPQDRLGKGRLGIPFTREEGSREIRERDEQEMLADIYEMMGDGK